MVFSVSRFNSHLATQGQKLTWAKAAVCPCRDPHSGSPKPSCPVCRGKGFLWSAPVPTHAGVAGMKVQREWAREGEYESGDVVVSIPSDTPLYACGERDRVCFIQSTVSFDVAHLRGGPAERYLFTIASFSRCFWLTPDGASIIEGGLPVQAPDFSLSWPAGQLEPPAGVRYTLQGRKNPEYFIFKDLAQDRAHYMGQALPRRVALRRFDLLGK